MKELRGPEIRYIITNKIVLFSISITIYKLSVSCHCENVLNEHSMTLYLIDTEMFY